MATQTLVNGSTDLTQTTSYDGAALPITGDTFRIPRGSQTINTFFTDARNFAAFELNFFGVIESAAGAALKFDCSGTANLRGANGRVKFGTGSVTSKWDIVNIKMPDSWLSFSDGEFEDVICEACAEAIFDTDAVVDVLKVYGGNVILQANSNTVAAELYGGTTTARRGGTYNLHGDAVLIVDVTNGASPTIKQYSSRSRVVQKNGVFSSSSELKAGYYVDQSETPIVNDGVTVGPGLMLTSSVNVTWTNTVREGIQDAGNPLIA